MNPENCLEWTTVFIALMPLRMIRDWCADEDLAAFAGDPEKQFKELYEKLKAAVIDAGIITPGSPDPAQKEAWGTAFETLENRLWPLSQPPSGVESKKIVH